MRKLLTLCSLLLAACCAWGQSTTATATIADPSGTVWANGTWTVQWVPAKNNPGPYYWKGALFVPQVYTGTMNGSGAMSVTVPDTSTVTPSGSQWTFTLCPNASAPCGIVTTPVTGASEDFTTLFSSIVRTPEVSAPALPRGYTTAEVPSPAQGAQFWDVTHNAEQLYDGVEWLGTAPTPVTAEPASCPIGNVYQIEPGYTGAGRIYANSGTGTTCGLVSDPGTGSVSLVSNSDGTLTISPTTGAVVASLALGHANTWTANQAFESYLSMGVNGTLDWCEAAGSNYGLDPACNGGWFTGMDDIHTDAPRDLVVVEKSGQMADTSCSVAGTATLTCSNMNFNYNAVGYTVAGTDIPNGTTIATYVDATHVTMSAAATGTAGPERVTFTPAVATNPDLMTFWNNGFSAPYLENVTRVTLRDIYNLGIDVDMLAPNPTTQADCGYATGSTAFSMDASNPLKIYSTAFVNTSGDTAGWLYIASTSASGWIPGLYYITSASSGYALLSPNTGPPAPLGATGGIGLINPGRIMIGGSGLTGDAVAPNGAFYFCAEQQTPSATTGTMGWRDLSSLQYNVSPYPGYTFIDSGYDSFENIYDTNSGSRQLGLNNNHHLYLGFNYTAGLGYIYSGYNENIAFGHGHGVGGSPIQDMEVGKAGILLNQTPQAIGTNSVTGCSITSIVGGGWAGGFTSGTSGTCTVVITPPATTAPGHGFSCWANDLTTPADSLHQTSASTTTTATMSGTTVSGDLINYGCVGY